MRIFENNGIYKQKKGVKLLHSNDKCDFFSGIKLSWKKNIIKNTVKLWNMLHFKCFLFKYILNVIYVMKKQIFSYFVKFSP